MRDKSQGAQAKLAARSDFTFELALTKENALANRHFSAGPDECLPRICVELTRQEDFDSSTQMLRKRRPSRRLGMNAGTTSKQACGDDARIV